MFEKNIPVPNSVVSKKYHFEKMQVGDSISVPADKRYRQVLSRLVSDYGNRHKMKFTIRKIDDQSVRVWRTE